MRTHLIGLGVLFLLASTACSAEQFASGDAGGPGDDAGNVPPNNGGSGDDAGSDAGAGSDAALPPGCDETKLPTDDACVVNDAAGVFVSSSMGSATGDGTKAKPLASLDAAIAAAKAAHKRVYACADTYAEQIHLADGVDVFGYFACSSSWAIVQTAHAKVLAPASPAAIATNISDATRVEAVDLVAPDFTDESQSSIALVADHSPALTIKSATIHAGTGGKGDDGTNGVQLSNGSGIDGTNSWADGVCTGNCTLALLADTKSAAGGTNACVGATGHDGGDGGNGGTGGEFQSQFFINGYIWNSTGLNTAVGSPTSPTTETAQGGGLGVGGSTGSPGADGTDGPSGVDFGNLSAAGYVAADGLNGTDGAPGQGGGGSGGANWLAQDYPAGNYAGYYAWGEPGAGGGAGGCPGLAGTAGKGGGASIAVVAVESPLTLDTVVVVTSAGGAGGTAGVAGTPTSGGIGGKPVKHTIGAGNGGAGGKAGVSGNGGGGPSIGIAYQGTAPTELATTVTAGVGGAGVASRVGNDGKTIPASMSGRSANVYAWGL